MGIGWLAAIPLYLGIGMAGGACFKLFSQYQLTRSQKVRLVLFWPLLIRPAYIRLAHISDAKRCGKAERRIHKLLGGEPVAPLHYHPR